MPDDYDRDALTEREREIEHDPWQPHRRRRGSMLPVLLALVVVAAAAVAVYFVFLAPKPPAPSPAAAVAPTPAVTATPTRGPLPGLDESDSFIRGLAAALSSHPEVARWLGRTSLVRTLTSVVANLANGESPRHDLDFLAPRQRFRAAAGGSTGRVVADPASHAAYDVFADAVASIDASAAAGTYTASEPLFDAAYRDLGFPHGFRPALDGAIETLLEVPVPRADAELVAGDGGGFRWADPQMEALSRGQKHLLRMGPRNVRLVQEKLRELQAALGSR